MGLDIRLPIGMMFTLLGLLLGGYGFYTGGEPDFYRCSLGININLVWGGLLFGFGGVMWLLAKRDASRAASEAIITKE